MELLCQGTHWVWALTHKTWQGGMLRHHMWALKPDWVGRLFQEAMFEGYRKHKWKQPFPSLLGNHRNLGWVYGCETCRASCLDLTVYASHVGMQETGERFYLSQWVYFHWHSPSESLTYSDLSTHYSNQWRPGSLRETRQHSYTHAW